MKRSLHNTGQTTFLILLAAIGSAVCCTTGAIAQNADSPTEKYGVWDRIEGGSGKQILQMRLRVYPQAAPMPAFRYRLVPAPKDRVDGNSALFYLKAIGFFEQTNAKEKLIKLQRKWREQATEEDRDAGDYPPNTWYDAAPESLPMQLVKQYLDLHSFQPEFLYDAARRTRFEHDRAMERESNPIGYLLPSIQQHREIARVQTVRCRYAIAEGRIDDAIEIVGQLLAMGRHVGSDEFLVSCLVGAAIHRIGTDAGMVLSQQPDAPNLYWAIAACPDPAIDLSRGFAWERELLLMQMPILKEVTEKVRPPEFWADFTKRFAGLAGSVTGVFSDDGKAPEQWDAFKAATVIARDYPTARDFLGEVAGMSDKQLDQYPKAQVVFLAIIKYYEFAQDESLKQFVVPFASRQINRESELMKYWRSRFSPSGNLPEENKSFLLLGDLLVPATSQVIGAAVSTEQRQNLWQTVEALRLMAAENGDEFPTSLDQLTVPAPLDPATNRTFDYELNEGVATLRGARIGGNEFQIKLELAKRNEQQEKTK